MKIQIKKQHLQGAKYMNHFDCPMARALKELGYTDVLVRGHDGDATLKGVRYQFKWDTFDLVHGFGSHQVEQAQANGNKPFTAEVERIRY